MKRRIIQTLERLFGCRIYRNSLPRGVDIFFDIERCYGLKNFRTVFDIGANVGQSAEAYHKTFPSARIHSFEPVLRTFVELESISRRLDRVQAYRLAFGSKVGEAEIGIGSDSRKNTIRHRSPPESEVIPVSTVDRFCRDQAIEAVDFMKIDTEGYELEVLNGALRMLGDQRIQMLYIEAEPIASGRHFTPFKNLVDVLTELGYSLFGIYEQQPHWTGEKNLLFFNPVFISREMAKADVRMGE